MLLHFVLLATESKEWSRPIPSPFLLLQTVTFVAAQGHSLELQGGDGGGDIFATANAPKLQIPLSGVQVPHPLAITNV